MLISRRSRLFRFLRPMNKQKLVLNGLIVIIGLIVVGFLFSFVLFAWYARGLPSPGKLSQSKGNSTIFYDRDGKVLYEMYKDKNRVPVAFDQISEYLKKATVSIEDKDFYNHKGISERGMLRAAFNIMTGKSLQSGSTITQQLIKISLLDSRQTASRKIREVILAMEVERRYSKNQILEMYLNEAPYGGTFYGVGSASMGYFGKPPSDLNLVESAILAGLPQNPSYYSPYIGGDDSWKGRAKSVLRRMREDKHITKDQEQKAVKQVDSYKFSSPKLAINAPHFVFYIKNLLEEQYGSKILDQGVRVKTTLSLEVQQMAEKVVKEEIEKLKTSDVDNGAAVVLDSKTGEILAMVGSYDFNDEKYGKFNVASNGKRQPGSTVKPITYAVALEKGYTASTVLMDVKTTFPNQGAQDYNPVNYDGKFRGPAQLRFSLGNSLNIPAVKMLAMVGIKDFLQKAEDMGLKTLAPTDENIRKFGLAVTLGGGDVTLVDLTSAFSVFARGGVYKELQGIQEIKDFSGKTIYRQVKTKETQALKQEVAFIISHILSDNNARMEAFGPRSYLNVSAKTVAVKTGTTNDKRDNWTVGFTKGVTVGVWVGNHDNRQMNPRIASGVTGASPIWNKIMTNLLKKYEDGIIDKPDNVEAIQIDAYLGGLPKDGYSTRSEYFIKGTEPKEIAPFYKKVKISKATGKLANDVESRTGNYDEKDYIIITENDPVSTDGKNRWQEAIDAWAREQTDDKFKPPTETSDASAEDIVVSIKSPNNQSTVDTNDVVVKAKIGSVAAVTNVKIFFNGVEKKNIDGDKKDIEETINVSDGVYDLKITARNDKGKTAESTIKVGVKQPWDITPTPTTAAAPTNIVPTL